MNISVIIPVTREKIVKKCVEALSKQAVKPYEIIFIIPCGWEKLRQALKIYLVEFKLDNAKVICSKDKRQMSMLNKGIEESKGKILAFTDDDGAPFPDWIKRIEEYFKYDPNIGGVGGKDIFIPPVPGLKNSTRIVGKVSFYGRLVGHHSEWNSGPIEVDHIKGCNMSFRKDAFPEFDEDLLGNQCGNEIDVSLKVKKNGYKIIYDPEILIHHYIALKPEIWEAADFKERIYVSTFNHTLILLKNLSPLRKFLFLLYSSLIGQKLNPGFLEILIFIKHSKKMTDAIPYIIAAKTRAIKHYLEIRKVEN